MFLCGGFLQSAAQPHETLRGHTPLLIPVPPWENGCVAPRWSSGLNYQVAIQGPTLNLKTTQSWSWITTIMWPWFFSLACLPFPMMGTRINKWVDVPLMWNAAFCSGPYFYATLNKFFKTFHLKWKGKNHLGQVLLTKGGEQRQFALGSRAPKQCWTRSNVASSSGPSQILSRSRGEKSGEGLGAKLRHGLEMVDSVST